MGAILGLGLVWFVVEIAVWIGIAQFTSGWWVFLWFIAAFMIGSGLLKKGMQNLNPMAQQMKQGGFVQAHTRPPDSVMTKSMALVAAGVLLMIPGVLSDILALLMMLPPVQNKLKNLAEKYIRNNQEKMMEMMMKQMQNSGMDPSQFGGGAFGGQNPFGNGSPFGGKSNPFGNQNPFGGNAGKYGGFGKTVDGSAKVVKDNKKITHAANDD